MIYIHTYIHINILLHSHCIIHERHDAVFETARDVDLGLTVCDRLASTSQREREAGGLLGSIYKYIYIYAKETESLESYLNMPLHSHCKHYHRIQLPFPRNPHTPWAGLV